MADAVVTREEAVASMVVLTDVLHELRLIRQLLEATMKKKMTRAEREAHDRRVDEDIRRLRRLAERGLAELKKKQQSV